MLLRKYRTYFKEQLEPLYDAQEVDQFFYMLLEEYHQMKRYELALDPSLILDDDKQPLWDFALSQLLNQRPIQYILSKTFFYDLQFFVNPNTLIPRPETEELVDWIVKDHSQTEAINILDIGTGSGCIAISLAKNIKNANVYAMDVSEKALEVAKQNAITNEVNVTFIQADVLTLQSLDTTFDVIVSNPPYVRNLEKVEIQSNVLDNEPHLALFVEDDDPLIFYTTIADLAQKSLKKDGLLYYEINQYLGQEMVQMLTEKRFSNTELRKDIYGKDRMTKAQK